MTKCFVDGSKLCLTNLSEIQKLIMEVNPNLKDDNTNFQWCQHHLIFTNNDLFSVLKLPPLSVLSLFSLLGLKSMQPFSISEPRWNKISVILSKWYYQIHKYNYTNTKIQVDKYKFTNKSQWNHTVFWSQGEKNQCNFGTLVLCCFSFQLTNTFDTRWGFPAPRGSSWKGVTSPPAEMMVVKLIVGWIIVIIANFHHIIFIIIIPLL